MKKLIVLSVISICSLTANAESLLSGLVNINDRWAYEQMAWANLAETPNTYSETELIQKHLYLVYDELKSRDVKHLSETEKINRSASLENLKCYAERGLFPQNITHQGRRPIFIDGRGVHCAVGYLIKESGSPELSRHISRNMNDAYVLEMDDQYLNEWVSQSGFTPQELAWIQPGYFQPVDYEPLKGGVDGPVFTMIEDNTGGLIAAGLFDSADGMPAGGIAQYYSGFAGFDWTAIGGTGVLGQIYDMEYFQGNLYVAGDFYMADTVNIASGVAMWDGNKWMGIGEFYIGALPNYVRDLEVYRDTLYAGGFLRSTFTTPEQFFGLAKWDGTEWRATAADLSGEVFSLKSHNGKLIVAGNFQMNDTSVSNIIQLNGNTVEYFAEDLAVPVNDVEVMGGEIYVGTEFYNQSKLDTLGLAVYRNGAWENLFGPEWGYANNSGGVKCIKPYGNYLLLGGDFDIMPVVGNYGRNMGYYSGGVVYPLGILDTTVNSMMIVGDILYLGGQFNSAMGSTGAVALNHVAQLYLPDHVSVKELEGVDVEIYPNPSSGALTLSGISEPVDEITVVDVKGAVFNPGYEYQGFNIKMDLSKLKPGVYILHVKMGSGYYQKKISIK